MRSQVPFCVSSENAACKIAIEWIACIDFLLAFGRNQYASIYAEKVNLLQEMHISHQLTYYVMMLMK